MIGAACFSLVCAGVLGYRVVGEIRSSRPNWRRVALLGPVALVSFVIGVTLFL